MLSSIHPLGERARSNRWPVTFGAFALGAMLAGATLGGTVAFVGDRVRFSSTSALVPAVVIGAAALADLFRWPVPTPHRQVNERWIGTYRGWVYGLGFGMQLGVGFATYLVTWAIPALVLVLAWIGDPVVGLWVGALFGLGRTLPLAAAGWINRPDRLTSFNRAVASLAQPAQFVAAILLLTLAAIGGLAA